MGGMFEDKKDWEGKKGMFEDKKGMFEGEEAMQAEYQSGLASSTRVLVASALQEPTSADTNTADGSSGLTIGIIVGACAVCALLVAVAGVVVMRQRQNST